MIPFILQPRLSVPRKCMSFPSMLVVGSCNTLSDDKPISDNFLINVQDD